MNQRIDHFSRHEANYISYICSPLALHVVFLFSAVNHADKVTEGIVSLKCELARLYREMNTLVRWNRPLPIVLSIRFTFRRIIRSARSTLLFSVRKDEERNRKTLPLHSSNSCHNYCCHSLLQTVGRRIAEIVPRMLRCRRFHTGRLKSPLWPWRLNPTERNARELWHRSRNTTREKSRAGWRRQLWVPVNYNGLIMRNGFHVI